MIGKTPRPDSNQKKGYYGNCAIISTLKCRGISIHKSTTANIYHPVPVTAWGINGFTVPMAEEAIRKRPVCRPRRTATINKSMMRIVPSRTVSRDSGPVSIRTVISCRVAVELHVIENQRTGIICNRPKNAEHVTPISAIDPLLLPGAVTGQYGQVRAVSEEVQSTSLYGDCGTA